MLEAIPGIRRLSIPMGGGLDESSAVTDVKIEDFIELLDWRISQDGKRIEKRYGIDTVKSDFGADVYGGTTYNDSDDAFCQLAIIEGAIHRKVASAAWANIHSFSSNIAHPVIPLEIQGKQFIINEVDSRMIHIDKADYQIGITAPATLPTLTSGYDDAMIEEDMAAIADWSDNDAGAGASTQVTYDSKSCMKLLNTGNTGDIASRSRYTTNNKIPAKFVFETSLYMNTLGTLTDENHLTFWIGTGDGLVGLIFDAKEIHVVNSATDSESIKTGIVTKLDQWVDVKFVYNGSDPDAKYCEIYIDDKYEGKWYITNDVSSLAGYIDINLFGETVATEVYIDYFNLSDTEAAELNGKYRYAVTYARSGNYGCESNPIKSLIGSPAFTGTGTAGDLTVAGTYSGDKDRTLRVEVESLSGTSVANFKFSYNSGNKWHMTGYAAASTMYIPLGIEVSFTDSDDHIVGDYWDIELDALALLATNQKVTLSSIPTSSDAQVDQRKIYRTVAGGAKYYYWLTTINDNIATTFVDNVPDTSLGLTMEEDKDVLPNGKFSAWWDDRLWVTGDNCIYYSEIDYPEEFDTTNRKINVMRGEQHDEITGLKEFGDNLYIFKRHAVYVIQKKAGLAYGRYKILDDVGCYAGWSIVEANNLLMWLSDRGIELFNGQDVYSPDFSVAVKRTFSLIEKSKGDCISAVHYRDYNEVWWSLPDRGSGASLILVYDYLKHKFTTFSQTKEISTLSLIETSTGAEDIAVGARDGFYGNASPSTTVYADWGVGAIAPTQYIATARKGWINLGKGSHLHAIEIEFESVTDKDLTLNIYLDMDKDVFYTATLSGKTPTATDQELRRPILHFANFGGRETRYFNYELINTDGTSGDCKLNRVDIFFVPKIIKRTQEPD